MEALHDQLRDCVDLMGIGTGMPRADTVAEEGVAVTKADPKDLGDVRYSTLKACRGFVAACLCPRPVCSVMPRAHSLDSLSCCIQSGAAQSLLYTLVT